MLSEYNFITSAEISLFQIFIFYLNILYVPMHSCVGTHTKKKMRKIKKQNQVDMK